VKVILVREVLVSDGGYPSTSIRRMQTVEGEVSFVEPEPLAHEKQLVVGDWQISGAVRGAPHNEGPFS
jgi:hypothetical protein